MAIIYNYPLNSILLAEDMLIGTSTNIVNGQPKNATKNFSIADLTGFIKQNVSLNDVLLVDNASLLNAKVGGIYLYDTPVTDYGNILLNQNRFSFNTVTHGEVFRAQRDMFSSFSSSGYRGSFEVSNITANRVWDLPNKSGTVALLSDVPVGATPTLQEVTDTGAITTDTITVGGITSGNLYSDGYNFGISDNYDTNYNMLYQPFVGLQITNNSDYVYLYQDASIGFQTVAGDGNLRSDLLTGTRSWQFPDASGTLALLSDIPIIPTIGTWGTLNYPVWTTGTPFVKMTAVGTFALDTTTYYPYPTGTISQYIRGDGTFATFPSITIPTLQQVTTAGNTTTDTIFLQNGVSPLSVILTNNYISLADTSTGKQISISTNNDIGFIGAGGSSLYLKSPSTITGTNTQTLQNATGTVALLSDIVPGITAINSLTGSTQTLATNGSGTDFNISSVGTAHTFNLPTASAANRGALSSADWTTFNNKQNALTYTPYRFTAPSQIVHTGVLTETILQTILIPANTFTNGDFIMFSALVAKLTTLSTTSNQIKINTTNTLVGASIIGQASFNTTNLFMKFKREFVVNSGNIYGYVTSIATVPNDQVVSYAGSAGGVTAYNLSNNLYLFVTCTLANILDTVTYRGINFYKQ